MTTEARELKQYLTFRLGSECFAIEVAKAREILDMTTITRVPQTPDFMLGVINLRSSVVPVIDMRLKFGMASLDHSVDTCIIVMEVAVAGELLTVGVLVDSVQEVINLDVDEIEPPPRIGTRLRTEFLKGMGHHEGGLVMILDIDRIFSSEEVSLVQEAVGEAV